MRDIFLNIIRKFKTLMKNYVIFKFIFSFTLSVFLIYVVNLTVNIAINFKNTFFSSNKKTNKAVTNGFGNVIIQGEGNNSVVVSINGVPVPNGMEVRPISIPGSIGVYSIVSRDLNWKLGSSVDVEFNGKNADLTSHFASDGIKNFMMQFNGLVAVGAASHELSSEGEIRESTRALERAEKLQLVVKEEIPNTKFLYILNLCRNAKNARISNKQRLIVLIGINTENKNEIENSINYKNIRDDSDFPLKVEDYSCFELRSYR